MVTTQVPVAHDPRPRIGRQLRPHAPQFSAERSGVSQPLLATASQSPNESMHSAEQVPDAQLGIELGRAGQRRPHNPQLVASVCVSVSQPSAAVPLQSSWPTSHAAISHMPMRHSGRAWGSEQLAAAPLSTTPSQSSSARLQVSVTGAHESTPASGSDTPASKPLSMRPASMASGSPASSSDPASGPDPASARPESSGTAASSAVASATPLSDGATHSHRSRVPSARQSCDPEAPVGHEQGRSSPVMHAAGGDEQERAARPAIRLARALVLARERGWPKANSGSHQVSMVSIEATAHRMRAAHGMARHGWPPHGPDHVPGALHFPFVAHARPSGDTLPGARFTVRVCALPRHLKLHPNHTPAPPRSARPRKPPLQNVRLPPWDRGGSPLAAARRVPPTTRPKISTSAWAV